MKKIERRPIAGAVPLTPMEMNGCHLSLGHSPLRATPRHVKKPEAETQKAP